MIKPAFYITILFLTLVIPLQGQQNLVVNGDFELYDLCPAGSSTPFDYQINHCLGWTTPTYATSDYFNSCSSNFTSSIPNNNLGYQLPNSGNGYCGFLACSYDTLSNYQWWEYIQGKVNPLNQGNIYKLSLNLNLAEDSYYWLDKIGVYLSNTPYNDYTSTLPQINITPQFQTPLGVHISDTSSWMYFEWYFIANGNERFITIGNFNDFYHSNAVLSPQGGTKGNSYIFIDDVAITLEESIEPANIFTPNNDGVNDFWVYPLSTSDNSKITILNRWGNIITEGNLNGFKWDGKTNNNEEECADGTYYYRISNTNLAGFIQLIR